MTIQRCVYYSYPLKVRKNRHYLAIVAIVAIDTHIGNQAKFSSSGPLPSLQSLQGYSDDSTQIHLLKTANPRI